MKRKGRNMAQKRYDEKCPVVSVRISGQQHETLNRYKTKLKLSWVALILKGLNGASDLIQHGRNLTEEQWREIVRKRDIEQKKARDDAYEAGLWKGHHTGLYFHCGNCQDKIWVSQLKERGHIYTVIHGELLVCPKCIVEMEPKHTASRDQG